MAEMEVDSLALQVLELLLLSSQTETQKFQAYSLLLSVLPSLLLLVSEVLALEVFHTVAAEEVVHATVVLHSAGIEVVAGYSLTDLVYDIAVAAVAYFQELVFPKFVAETAVPACLVQNEGPLQTLDPIVFVEEVELPIDLVSPSAAAAVVDEVLLSSPHRVFPLHAFAAAFDHHFAMTAVDVPDHYLQILVEIVLLFH